MKMTLNMCPHYDVIHLVRIYYPNIGGMELIVHEIARRQVERGLSVAIVTSTFSRTGEPLAGEEKFDSVPVYRLNSLTIRSYILPTWKIRVSPSSEILHVHGLDPFVDFHRALIKHRRLILSPHGAYFHTPKFRALKNIYWHVVTRALYSGATAMTISNEDRIMISRLIPSAQLMGCGFKERVISRSGGDVLILGRVSMNKNSQASIDVAKLLFPGHRVHVVGPIEDGMSVNGGKSVVVHGAVSDEGISRIAEECGYFVCLSRYEGLGMTLVEALYMGLRCVVSDIPTFREISRTLGASISRDWIYFWGDNNEDAVSWIGSSPMNEVSKIRLLLESAYSWDTALSRLDDAYGGNYG